MQFQVLLLPPLLSNDTHPGIYAFKKLLKAEIKCVFPSIHKLFRSFPLRKVWTKHYIFTVHQEKPPGGTQPLSQLKIKEFRIQPRGNNSTAMHIEFQELLKKTVQFGQWPLPTDRAIHHLLTQPSPVPCCPFSSRPGALAWNRKGNT